MVVVAPFVDIIFVSVSTHDRKLWALVSLDRRKWSPVLEGGTVYVEPKVLPDYRVTVQNKGEIEQEPIIKLYLTNIATGEVEGYNELNEALSPGERHTFDFRQRKMPARGAKYSIEIKTKGQTHDRFVFTIE